jgi:hypothetical protein
MSPTDPKDIDPLADLDDDLGDDWESAFQSEEFMFSPDEEANDFFLFDENDSEEDINELTSIMENAERETLEEQQNTSLKDTASESSETDPETPEHTLPAKIISTASALLSSFKNRPLYQRVLITAAPCCIVLLFLGTFFLKSTSEELAQTKQHDIVIADVNVGPEIKTAPVADTTPPQKILPPQPEEKQVQQERTIRKQWDFPTFTIVSTSPDNETLFVNINLSLIAVLPEGGALPEGKNTLAKDIIYQFYQNRSSRELQHFALARGETIHKLHHWLQKEWPDSPVNTVIFSQYQVIHTPHTS